MKLLGRLGFRVALFLVSAVAVLMVAALVFVGSPQGALMPEAEAAMRSDTSVQVSSDDWLSFSPVAESPSSGFIFYPGGRVQPEAYAPLARDLAEAGYLTVIAPMPLNLAILDVSAADRILAVHPEIQRWVIGGHSLGGTMAARYAHANPDTISGLALLAAYPEAHIDFSRRDLTVASIYAENDGLATVAEVEASFALLPDEALRVKIAGGNHAQFGWYGEQDGDKLALISRMQQHEQVLEVVLRLMDAVGR